MSTKHPHRKVPDNKCPKCGATEGVSRVMNYYYCESCHQKEQADKQTPVSTASSR